MSKLSTELAWSDEAKAILEQTDKESAKAVCVSIGKAAEVKDTKVNAMKAIQDLAAYGKENMWVEPYLITLFPTIMAACADKLHNLQTIQADLAEQGEALWARFKRGRNQQAWYYRELARVFTRRGGGLRLFQRFADLVAQVFPA